MNLTNDEVELLARAVWVRAHEDEVPLWWCPKIDYFSSAVQLHRRGLIDRSWHGDEAVFRATDQSVVGVALFGLMDRARRSVN